MSHEKVLTSLRGLLKQELTAIDPIQHIESVIAESDRSALILNAAMIEDILAKRLILLMPSINSDERDRIFNFEGPLGSFSNKIRLSQAFGIIDRENKRRIEIIKEVRNVAAHCHSPIQFDTPEIHAAIAQLFPPNAREAIIKWNRAGVKSLYITMISRIGFSIAHFKQVDAAEVWASVLEKGRKLRASPEKSSGA